MLTMKRDQFVPADGQLHHSLPLCGRWQQPNIIFCIKYETQKRQMVGNRFYRHTRTQRCKACKNERGSLRFSDRNIHHVSLTASLSIQPTFHLFYFKEWLSLSHNAGYNITFSFLRTIIIIIKKSSLILKISAASKLNSWLRLAPSN